MTPSPAPDGATRVHLGLGSNLGDRRRNIERAVELLGERMQVECVSRFYETPPMYEERQPPFLNAVCRCASPPAPRDLLRFIQEIEANLGRVPGPKNSPRPLDIDILLYGSLTLDEPHLVIPHPGIAERPFVLIPLAEIDANAVHPVTGKTTAEMLAELAPEPEAAIPFP